MIATLFWKEFREQCLVFLTLAGIIAAVNVALANLLPVEVAWPDSGPSGLVWGVTVLAACAYASLCGALLLAEQRGVGTSALQEAPVGGRTALWVSKVATGALFITGQTLFLGLLLVSGGLPLQSPAPGLGLPDEVWPPLLAAALWTFAWSLLAAAFCKQAFPAIVLSMPVAIITMFYLDEPSKGMPGSGIAGWTIVQLVLLVVVVWGSWRVYTRAYQDGLEAAETPGTPPVLAPRPGTDPVWIRTLAWKEYREHRTTWMAVAALAAFLIVGAALLIEQNGINLTASNVPALVLSLTFATAVVYGLICGSMMLAGEEEARTLPFLDILTGRREPVWSTKLRVGLALTLAQALVIGGLFVVVGHWFPAALLDLEMPTPSVLIALLLTSIYAYAGAMLSSALCANTLAAFGVSVVIFVATSFSSAVAGFIPGLGKEAAAFLIFQGIFALGSLIISRIMFCAPDAQRLPTFPPDVLPTATPVPQAGAWDRLLWLTWHQGYHLILVLLLAAPPLGLCLWSCGIAFWPFFSLFLGVVCGLTTFAPEQTRDDYRFLGDRRFPLARFWVVKTGFWFAVAAGVALVTVAVGVLNAPATEIGLFGDRAKPEQSVVLMNIGPRRYFALWLVYGFTVGELLTLMVRKSVVTAVLSVLVSGAMAALWLPSLIIGGLNTWQPAVVPVLLIAASFLALRPWAAGRLLTGRNGWYLVGFAFLVAAWMAGCLSYRFLEIPDVGPGFDLRQFVKSLPSAQENKAGRLVRQALAGLQREVANEPVLSGRLKALVAAEPQFLPGHASRPGLPAPGQHLMLINQEDPAAARWLDHLFRAPWISELQSVTDLPPGSIEDPLAASLIPSNPFIEQVRLLISLLQARGWQLLGQGHDREILDHLAVMLTVSRNLRKDAATATYSLGLELQDRAVELYDAWLLHLQDRIPTNNLAHPLMSANIVALLATPFGGGPLLVSSTGFPANRNFVWPWSIRTDNRIRANFLKQALETLARHETEAPPLSGCVKAQYLAFRNTLNSTPAWQDAELEIFRTARIAPWERARTDRIVNAFFAGFLRAAETDYWKIVQEGVGPPAHSSLMRSKDWVPPSNDLSASLSRERMAALIDETLAVNCYVRAWQGIRTAEAVSTNRLRELRVLLAGALYRIENGKPPQSVDALIPRYLPVPLVNPLAGWILQPEEH